jgi:sulfite exporter TauE/SafE
MKKKLFFLIFTLLLFIAAFIIIKTLGFFQILSVLNDKDNINYGIILLIGFLASFHCVGMCGGLVITYSVENLTKNRDAFKAHFQYNLGRIISYTLIGALLGAFGSFFSINNNLAGAMMIFAGIFMILMGVSLIKKINWLEKIKPHTPLFIARFIYSQKIQTPLLIGLMTGLMPCGPLQAMQLYALSTASFWRGGLSMLIYALGTIPVMFGFGNLISKIGQEKIKYFMKLSGVIVIILALFMLNRGLINLGYNFFIKKDQPIIINDENAQIIQMNLTRNGYEPNTLYAKKSIPVKWIINVQEISGCTSQIIMPEYNIKKNLQKGENIIEFTPDKTGEIKFSCGMQMVWGKFIISE